MNRVDLRPLALVGLRGAGKTTVGKLLAARLALECVDLDDRILRFAREELGSRVEQGGALLEQCGEPRFRELESQALARVLDETAEPRVIATGGGVVELAANRSLLRRRARCAWLYAPAHVLRDRLARDSTLRPGLTGEDALAELDALLARREGWYGEVADLVLDQGRDGPERIVERLIAAGFVPGRS